MLAPVLLALSFAFILYLAIGVRLSKKTKNIADMLPLKKGGLSIVKNSNEFSNSTVAVTISLATVILTFYELSPYFGFWWLLFPVITTSLGIYVVRLMAKPIWRKLRTYKNKPSLHEFLSVEYNSPKLALIGATATSLGFLGAFAVELTVGGKFLGALIPEIPQYISIIVLSLVAVIYTMKGGFRAVIVTDKYQMITIWLLLFVLVFYYIFHIVNVGDIDTVLNKIPNEVLSYKWREGLLPFLIGIFILNVPTYLSDFGVWMRISASDDESIVRKGLWKSVLVSFTTWSIIVFLACFVFMFIEPVNGENSLFTFLKYISTLGSIEKIIIFFTTLGLFGAMLSTASTQLIVANHSIYEDIVSKSQNKSLDARIDDNFELKKSRIILFLSALISIVIVEVLGYFKFSIVDLMFAIYGSQLCLFTPVILALFLDKKYLNNLKTWCFYAIIIGFISGWSFAIYGKIINDGNLVFLSPLSSLISSSLIIFIGYIKMENNIYIDVKKGKGKSIFANKNFKKDEVILLICGPIMSKATIYSIPIDLDLFIDPVPYNNPAMYLCHDCEPNAGIKNNTLLVAYKDIKKGEEIAIDYAMIVYEYGEEMTSNNLVCNCYKDSCRKLLGSYKNLSDKQKKEYYPYLSDYLKNL